MVLRTRGDPGREGEWRSCTSRLCLRNAPSSADAPMQGLTGRVPGMDTNEIQGTGGSPTGGGPEDPEEAREAAADPDVAALVNELRDDDGDVDVRLEPEEASEHIGTGTDR